MNTPIYVATPDELVSTIPAIKGSVRFSGNDTKRINLTGLDYGSTLYLEDFDSLEEIHIQSPGAVISFSRFPEQTIRINGVFEEVIVAHEHEFYNINRHIEIDSSTMQTLAPTVWGAVISRDQEVDCQKLGALMLYTKNVQDIVLNNDLTHMTVIGDDKLKSIRLEGESEISKFVIHKAEVLEEVHIRKQVSFCSISRSPQIKSIVGIGDRLKLDKSSPSLPESLAIGGFWLNVPSWYKVYSGQLNISHLNSQLILDDIISCDDLGGTRFIIDPYDETHAYALFSSFTDEDLSYGLNVKDFVQLLQNNERGLNALEAWCYGDRTYFEQYIALRVVASLIYRGVNCSKVISIRNRILDANIRCPIVEETVSNRIQRKSKIEEMDYDFSNSRWMHPQNSVMPYNNIDLEIWLHTDLGVEFLGMDKMLHRPTKMHSNVYSFRYPTTSPSPHKNPVVRNIIISALTATKSGGRSNDAEVKLVYLIDEIFSDNYIISDERCVQFLILHYDFSRSIRPDLITKMVSQIISIDIEPWKKAAFLFALIDNNNSTKARVALRKLPSNKSITINESRAINTVSVLGSTAFDTGKVARPRWPYITSWREEYKV